MKLPIGGERLGSGKKLEVDLHTYNRSTHNLDTIWRSTMSAGTLVPFLVEIALPGDTFDINLDCDVKTHPTIGPLFGSYKVQLDLFEAPLRLYNQWLHNNRLKVGLKMSDVKLPTFQLEANYNPTPLEEMDNSQINPSCIFAYLGVRGVGYNPVGSGVLREFMAVPWLAYWEIYKNYYANKQETVGFVMHTPMPAVITNVTTIMLDANTITAAPGVNPFTAGLTSAIKVNYTPTAPLPETIMFNTSQGRFSLKDLSVVIHDTGSALDGVYNFAKFGNLTILNWEYFNNNDMATIEPVPTGFSLDNIDTMRDNLLINPGNTTYTLNRLNTQDPYNLPLGKNANGYQYCLGSQEGLGIKTYQSDLNNNWIRLDWIDGPGGISEVTAIDTSSGSFTIDTLNLSQKIYKMMNRVAVSGGSYKDWLGAVYQETNFGLCESPMYHGGLIKELVFQEVVSNSASTQDSGEQPLGTLAGKGILAKKHKGGQAVIKVVEPSIILGIVSLTPRIDYSQGNRWFTGLRTMDDLHKPALDEIGFQDLITEYEMAWWDTQWTGTTWQQKAAGKQPAWLNYMTNINRTYGNFAIKTNEMFMTLNRNYNWNPTTGTMADLTSYIDPAKYNQIFAQTERGAQNFWVQIAIDMQVRRIMSAKLMPNL